MRTVRVAEGAADSRLLGQQGNVLRADAAPDFRLLDAVDGDIGTPLGVIAYVADVEEVALAIGTGAVGHILPIAGGGVADEKDTFRLTPPVHGIQVRAIAAVVVNPEDTGVAPRVRDAR